MTAHEIIDVHAHVYPEGCFGEVIKSRADFKLVDGPRGQALVYRGSHVMSLPPEQDNLPKRLASMDDSGIAMAILSVGALVTPMPRRRALSTTGWPRFVDSTRHGFVLSRCCHVQARTR